MKDGTIIMADIIKSSNKKGSKLMNQFRDIVESANRKFEHQLLSPLTITLGDEFQGIPTSILHAVEIILFMEEAIVSKQAEFRLRYVINQGEIATEINPERAHGMLGEGLSEARNNLENLKDEDQRFRIDLYNKDQATALNDLFNLYQWIVDEWKVKDYPIVSAFLELRDYKEVAKKLNKDVSLMWRREKSLNMSQYYSLKNIINYVVA